VDPWFSIATPRRAARVRLFCFPHAGGGASSYFAWSRAFAETIEVCAVQPPGRENRLREAPFTAIDPLIASLADSIVPFTDGRTFAFFGHSMGATVAFEAARQLDARGNGPVRLFASARTAPAVATRLGIAFDTEDQVMTYIRSLGGAGIDLLDDPDLRELALPMLQADFRLMESYQFKAGTRLSCPITVLAGSDDHTFTAADAGHWAQHTTAGITTETLPGGHFYTEEVPGLVTNLIARTFITEGAHQ
jgi:surfactin synthase thioesterase subunit